MRHCNNYPKYKNVFFVLLGYDLPKFEVKLEKLYSFKIIKNCIINDKEVDLSKIPSFEQTSIDFEVVEELKLRFASKKGIFDFDFERNSIDWVC